MKKPIIFILGAGFCMDAAAEAGNPPGIQEPVKYPSLFEFLKVCFDKNVLPPNKSIEDLFQESIDKRDRKPIKILCETLMEADYFITPQLKVDGSHRKNVYMRFLDDFPVSHLITFNYDSLPEILLLSKKVWRPEDGYGVPVRAKLKFRSSSNELSLPYKSHRVILHLHGSLCLYSDEFYTEYKQGSNYGMQRKKQKSDYIFDPDNIGKCFVPFGRISPTENYKYKEERVIAPVPNKAKGLKGEFIKNVYGQAIDLISNSRTIVVIGYSFNTNDLASYSPLLKVAAKKRVLLVSPDANSLVLRLKKEYYNIKWCCKAMSFKEWVLSDYPDL